MHAFWNVARTALVMTSLVAFTSTAAMSLSPTPAPAKAAPIVWPMSVASAGGTIVLSEPQVRTWPNYTSMTGIAAVAVTLPGASAPAYGTLAFTSLASADVPSGLVSLVNPKLTGTSWPTASAADATALDAFLKANLHLDGKPLLPLAMVLSSLPPSARPKTVPLRTNPPQILVSRVPALLVVFDGKPAFAPIAGTGLTYAVNTHWEIIRETSSGTYYVHSKAGWYSAPGADGPFTPTVAPASFAAIPATGALAWVKPALAAPKAAATTVRKVVVSTVPAELIDIDGQPQFANVPGTTLRYVTNTRADLFFSRDTTQWYVLLAGRWFAAANLNGPWTFASSRLPADFKKIPEDGPKGHVLVSVPGTTQAFYAANTAQVPRVTPVDPATQSLTVTYAGGAPAYKAIAGTPLQYAANASTDVVLVDLTHLFACDRGVWFASASANGPWTPATYVPAAIYTIPESSPLYHVTFVHVYDAQGVAQTAAPATPAPQPKATYQTFGAGEVSQGVRASYYNTATAGYMGVYAPSWGGSAYGTGYYTPGYVGNEFWVSNLPTYGNYNDTTFARERAQADATQPRGAALAPPQPPGHGPRSVPPPTANVYASDDGVYRNVGGTWQKNGAGDTWTNSLNAPLTLLEDQRARLAGYAGTVSG